MQNNRFRPLFSKSKAFLFFAPPLAPQDFLAPPTLSDHIQASAQTMDGLAIGYHSPPFRLCCPVDRATYPRAKRPWHRPFCPVLLDYRTHTHRAKFGRGARPDPGRWFAEFRAELSPFRLQDRLARPRRHGPELGSGQNGSRRRAGILAPVPSVATPLFPTLPIALDRTGDGLPDPVRGNPRPVLDADWHRPRRTPTHSSIAASQGRGPALLALQHVLWWLWAFDRLCAQLGLGWPIRKNPRHSYLLGHLAVLDVSGHRLFANAGIARRDLDAFRPPSRRSRCPAGPFSAQCTADPHPAARPVHSACGRGLVGHRPLAPHPTCLYWLRPSGIVPLAALGTAPFWRLSQGAFRAFSLHCRSAHVGPCLGRGRI